MKLAVFALAFLLAACGAHPRSAPEPIVVVQQVAVPVVGVCVPKGLGPAPEYIDNDAALKAAKEGPVRFQLLILGRAQRDGRLREVEPIIAGCPKEK